VEAIHVARDFIDSAIVDLAGITAIQRSAARSAPELDIERRINTAECERGPLP
jgi:hypothetical protein